MSISWNSENWTVGKFYRKTEGGELIETHTDPAYDNKLLSEESDSENGTWKQQLRENNISKRKYLAFYQKLVFYICAFESSFKLQRQ